MTTFDTSASPSLDRVDAAATLLRVTTGGLFLAHVWLKIFVFTPAGFAGYFASIGLPTPLAYLTILAELGAGIALIAGLWTRVVALLTVPLLLGAAWFGHGANGFFFQNENGGWEYPVYWAITMVVLALLGDGAWSVTSLGRKFARS